MVERCRLLREGTVTLPEVNLNEALIGTIACGNREIGKMVSVKIRCHDEIGRVTFGHTRSEVEGTVAIAKQNGDRRTEGAV
jgi:hypothetical protein